MRKGAVIVYVMLRLVTVKFCYTQGLSPFCYVQASSIDMLLCISTVYHSSLFDLCNKDVFFMLMSLQVEERMRVHHERKSRKLKRLDEKGAEAQKIDVTRKLVRSLSSKIRIAIQVVDKISVTINKLRDEELWPLINEFIQGYADILVIIK